MGIIATVLIWMLGLFSVAALVVGYVIWRGKRQMEDAAQKAARSSGGSGGPDEPA